MSGICNVGYCAMTWCDFRNLSSGQVLYFQQIDLQHDNKSCEREAKWVHHYGPQERSFGHSSFSQNTAKSFPPQFFKIHTPGIMFKIEQASTNRSY